MTDKQTIDCEYLLKVGEMQTCKALNVSFYHDIICNQGDCIILKLKQQIKAKEQEYEELQQYHNKCCKEFENKKQELLEKHNQVSIDFYSGKYCNKEKCSLLKAKEQECEELKKKCNIYTCGICGNKEDCNKLYKTLTEIKEIVEQGVKIHDDIIVSKQILQKISECEVCNDR